MITTVRKTEKYSQDFFEDFRILFEGKIQINEGTGSYNHRKLVKLSHPGVIGIEIKNATGKFTVAFFDYKKSVFLLRETYQKIRHDTFFFRIDGTPSDVWIVVYPDSPGHTAGKSLDIDFRIAFSKGYILAKSIKDDLTYITMLLEEQLINSSKIKMKLEIQENLIREVIMSRVYRDTVQTSDWFKENVSPGRWAAGYPFLYILYRVLNEFKPKNILELGLGQTTKLTSAYSDWYKDVSLSVAEHDEEWIVFFKNTFNISPNANIEVLPITFDGRYKEDTEVVSYVGFKERFGGMKYDLIIIDGPFGCYAKTYSRVDILSLLPDCLEKSFIILFDDSQRPAEQKTIAEIKEVLKKSGIDYAMGTLKGEKHTAIIASEDLRFYVSL